MKITLKDHGIYAIYLLLILVLIGSVIMFKDEFKEFGRKLIKTLEKAGQNTGLISSEYDKGPERPLDATFRYQFDYDENVPEDAIAINQTRGGIPSYQQYGYLVDNTTSTLLPLYGRQTYVGSNQYEYYTKDNSRNFIKIPIEVSGNRELMDGDSVTVDGYPNTFTVKIYVLEAPKYIPYI